MTVTSELLYELLVTPQVAGGLTADQLKRGAYEFLPGNVYAAIRDQPDVSVTVDHGGDDGPSTLQWWRNA